MRFFKNKIAQITMIVTLSVITTGAIAYATKSNPVYADDTASIKYVQEEIKKVQEQINELKTVIEEQQAEIESLKSENSNLKTKIESINYDSEIKDINNKIKSINAREDYLYDNAAQPIGVTLYGIARHINDNLR